MFLNGSCLTHTFSLGTLATRERPTDPAAAAVRRLNAVAVPTRCAPPLLLLLLPLRSLSAVARSATESGVGGDEDRDDDADELPPAIFNSARFAASCASSSSPLLLLLPERPRARSAPPLP